jgi:predicted methyltransferase
MNGSPELLGAARVRELAARLGLRPTKQWGQNFVVDANTVKRIVRLAGVTAADSVVEVGPGLGSLTLALLPEVAHVTAVEVDPMLAAALRTPSRSCSDAYRPAHRRTGRRPAPDRAARPGRPPSWPTSPTTSPCPSC